jgi:hypothetical protein
MKANASQGAFQALAIWALVLTAACSSASGSSAGTGSDAAPDGPGVDSGVDASEGFDAASCAQTWPLASSGTNCDDAPCPQGFVCYRTSGGVPMEGGASPSSYCYPLGDCAANPTCACIQACSKEFCVNGGLLTCGEVDGGAGPELKSIFCGTP